MQIVIRCPEHREPIRWESVSARPARAQPGRPWAWRWEVRSALLLAGPLARWLGATRAKVEDAYWRDAHRTQTFADSTYTYDDYAPAYRAGYLGYGAHSAAGRNFDAAAPDLERQYNSMRGNSRLGWDKAKHATRAAWDRVERALPGDADRDGK
jgi:hypothetical protein